MVQSRRNTDYGPDADFEAIAESRQDWDGADDRAEAANDRHLYGDD